MKTFVIFLFLLFISQNVISQRIIISDLDNDQLILYKEKAIKMRNTGRLLTLAGGALYLTSSILLVNYELSKPIWEWEPFPSLIYASFALIGGISTIAGIPLWIIGGIRKTRAEIALKKFDIKPGNSMAFGLGINIRF